MPDHAFIWEGLHALGKWPVGSVVIHRVEPGRWVFSPATVEGIDKLHQSLEPLPARHITQLSLIEDAGGQIMDLVGPTFARTYWWQWGILLLAIFVALAAGKLVQLGLRSSAQSLHQRGWTVRAAVLRDLSSPLSLAILALGLLLGMGFIHMKEDVRDFAHRVLAFLFLIAAGWFLYNLIELVDIWLRHITGKTDSKLDDMIAPLVRKTLRIFLVIVFVIVALQNIFELNITGFLASLGIAGLAISLAAQDSVKNLFGSLTVFFDKPFAVGDVIVFDGVTGTVEEIGFRSTRIRTFSGHLVTVPNMKFIDSKVENITARTSIRREMNITITYDTPPEKIETAVQLLRDVLHDPQIVRDGRFDMEEQPPRVAFNEFNDASLNIRAYYWYQLAGDKDRTFFTYLEHAQQVNLKLFSVYDEAGIEFAFPTQTLYLAGDPQRQLTVRLDQGDRRGDREARAYT
jgi:MscS family membrane protein